MELQSLVETFVARRGRPPEGVWSAPGRVNLIGEHTDYNDGFVLPVAIDRQVVVAAARRDDECLACHSLQAGDGGTRRLVEIGPGRSTGWAAYVHGVAWALAEAGVEVSGADLLIDSDLPAGAGLASSAALESAVALALADLYGAGLDRVDLALAAQRAEREVVGMPCGVMDQLASMMGEKDHALFIDTRSLTVEQVPLRLEAAGLRLVVIDTRVTHRLADAPYAERRQACHDAAAAVGVAALRDLTLEELSAAEGRLDPVAFRRARHVVTENARVLDALAALRSGQPQTIGPLLAASHASLRDDFEVSCPELDLAVTVALEAGAVAARMTGAGFGGSALALVPHPQVEPLAERVHTVFAGKGLIWPAVLPVATAGGARRLR